MRTLAAVIALFVGSSTSHAAIVATVDLRSFIQQGTVTNLSSSTLVEFTYSLGIAEDNLATWDGGAGGGVKSEFLADPRYFQTVTFGGLSVAPSGTFNFGTLDIDLIVTLAPFNVTGGILGGPETLRNAFVSVKFANGTTASADLVEQGWSSDQHLELQGNVSAVPEPGTLTLFSLGAFAFVGAARCRTKRSIAA